ncbi:hypothetical protein [Streptomyces sp. ME01-18h]|uniref:recombination directionality factor n=1 Tax=Streptomyces sp. ME01-18h TaxID=462920 RepID=UPI0029B748C3|nr:hypothetical protein [Streptomyces sp. ME01-18h]MDX3398396.1 hypothetical protein [Streptomyces sp. ME01-18h]
MPILTLQQRLRELGRIRIGQKVATAKGGTRPGKLDRFRLTSPSKELLDRVALRYGGTVTPWTPDGGAAQFEVITDAKRMPIHVPPQPVSQYFELWSGGGCQRRCDGVTELLKDRPCICGPDPEQRSCKPTTRLNVVLSEIEGVGVWRLESHGYYAALELPGVAELLAQTGGYVEAFLGLEQRTAKRDGQTRHWMVPTIDLAVTPAALMAGGASVGTAVASGPGRAAIEAPRPDYLRLASVAETSAAVRELYEQAVAAGHMNKAIADALTARAAELGAPRKAPAGTDQPQREAPPESAPDEEGVYEGEVIDDAPDPAAAQEVWFQIIAAAGPRGMTTEQVETAFARQHSGLHPSSATVAQLTEFLTALKGGAL